MKDEDDGGEVVIDDDDDDGGGKEDDEPAKQPTTMTKLQKANQSITERRRLMGVRDLTAVQSLETQYIRGFSSNLTRQPRGATK
mmetsp:Transcript_71859/g.156485  ORF Transcript_71859/g.156485 Transcript_71859/m.156485 type:complete len:84 (-) Transcript_71859:14-265(-)